MHNPGGGEEMMVVYTGGETPTPTPMFAWPQKPLKWKTVAIILAALSMTVAMSTLFLLTATNFQSVGSITSSVQVSTGTLAAKSPQIADMMDDMAPVMKAFRGTNMTALLEDVKDSAHSSRILMKALRQKRAISINLPFLDGEDEDSNNEDENSEPEPTAPPRRGNRPKPRQPGGV